MEHRATEHKSTEHGVGSTEHWAQSQGAWPKTDPRPAVNRPKTGHMTEGNDDKVTTNKDNQTPPLLPEDEGQAAESMHPTLTAKTRGGGERREAS